jgi:hypothetical protein
VCQTRPNGFIRADTKKITAGQQKNNIMIYDCTNGELDKIKAFAREKHLVREFVSTFIRFKRYTKRGYDVFLYPDWAPMSLAFQLKWNGKNDMNGGFIFHGVHDGGGNGGAPTFSVELNPDTKSHWSIHT